MNHELNLPPIETAAEQFRSAHPFRHITFEGLYPESMLDEPIRPGLLHPSGAVLGSGGIVVLDNSTPIHDVVRRGMGVPDEILNFCIRSQLY